MNFKKKYIYFRSTSFCNLYVKFQQKYDSVHGTGSPMTLTTYAELKGGGKYCA